MKNLEASGVKIIKGLVEDKIHKVRHATHLYSFDWLFSPKTLDKIYDFLRKRAGIYWASFQKPAALTENDLKFQLLGEVDGKMSRSTESHKCYVYKIL
jgi:hypothetical protein